MNASVNVSKVILNGKYFPVPGIPEQIKALAMTSDSIMVTWTRPSELNGIIVKYNVYIQHANKVCCSIINN